jgi:hypothetical protein
VFGIDRGLHVIARGLGSSHRHEAGFRFTMLAQLLDRRLDCGVVDRRFRFGIGALHLIQIPP